MLPMASDATADAVSKAPKSNAPAASPSLPLAKVKRTSNPSHVSNAMPDVNKAGRSMTRGAGTSFGPTAAKASKPTSGRRLKPRPNKTPQSTSSRPRRPTPKPLAAAAAREEAARHFDADLFSFINQLGVVVVVVLALFVRGAPPGSKLRGPTVQPRLNAPISVK